jgi:hypothetical protein
MTSAAFCQDRRNSAPIFRIEAARYVATQSYSLDLSFRSGIGVRRAPYQAKRDQGTQVTRGNRRNGHVPELSHVMSNSPSILDRVDSVA